MSRFFRSLGYALSILAACLMISGPAIAGSGSASSAFDVFKTPLPSLEEIRNSKKAESAKQALESLKDPIGRLGHITKFAKEGINPLLDKILKRQKILSFLSNLIDPLIDAFYGRVRKALTAIFAVGGGYVGEKAGGGLLYIFGTRGRLMGLIVRALAGAVGSLIGVLIANDYLPERLDIPKDPLDVDTHDQSFFDDELTRLDIPLPRLPADTPDGLRRSAQDYLQLSNLKFFYTMKYLETPLNAKQMKTLNELIAERRQDLCWQLEVRKRTPDSLIDMNRLADPRVSNYISALNTMRCEPARQIDCTLCSPQGARP